MNSLKQELFSLFTDIENVYDPKKWTPIKVRHEFGHLEEAQVFWIKKRVSMWIKNLTKIHPEIKIVDATIYDSRKSDHYMEGFVVGCVYFFATVKVPGGIKTGRLNPKTRDGLITLIQNRLSNIIKETIPPRHITKKQILFDKNIVHEVKLPLNRDPITGLPDKEIDLVRLEELICSSYLTGRYFDVILMSVHVDDVKINFKWHQDTDEKDRSALKNVIRKHITSLAKK